MKPSKFASKLLSFSNSSFGFTLTEMLVAASISSVVVGAAGFGLLSMMNADFVSAAKTQRRVELNRAVDYISDDIKQATKVEANSNNLKITLPNNDTITYAFNDIGSDNSSVWVKPGTITRKVNSGSATALVDGIINTTPSSLPACDPDGDGTSNLAGGGGFRFCIQNNRLANLYLFGVLKNAYGNTLSPLPVSNLTLARPNNSIDITQYINLPQLQNQGELVLTKPANLTFKVIGGAFKCNSSQPNANIGTKFKVNGTYANSGQEYSTNQSLSLPSTGTGTSIVVESTIKTNNSCVTSSQRTRLSTDTTFVKAFVNGDSVPSNTGYGGQASVKDLLQGFVNGNKIKLEPNQVIYLFEHYTATSGSTYDLQDNIVLVTAD
jgi:prepilin-type N-terminal cleavage/methylation domain-containing protein